MVVLCLQELQTYCDFPEVIDISIKQGNKEGSAETRIVSLTKQDNQTMVWYTLLLFYHYYYKTSNKKIITLLHLYHCLCTKSHFRILTF